MMCIMSPELTHLLTGNLYALASLFPFPPPPPLATNYQSTFWFYEFNLGLRFQQESDMI